MRAAAETDDNLLDMGFWKDCVCIYVCIYELWRRPLFFFGFFFFLAWLGKAQKQRSTEREKIGGRKIMKKIAKKKRNETSEDRSVSFKSQGF